MSLKHRLVLLVGMLLLVLIGSLLALRYLAIEQIRQVRAEAQQGRIALVDRWVELAGDSLRRFADDCSRWDELRRFVVSPEPRWPEASLGSRLAGPGACAAWVLGRDGAVIGIARLRRDATLAEPPVSGSAWLGLVAANPRPHFFAETTAGLIEVRGAPVQPLERDPAADATRGWILVAKRWGESQFLLLSSLTESRVRLAADPDLFGRPGDHGTILLERPLPDWRGRTVARLQFIFSDPDVAQMTEVSRSEMLVVAVFGLLLIGALAFGLKRWVLDPVGRISESLARADTTPLHGLLRTGNGTELGRVAKLIESHFAQRGQFLHEIEERKHAEAALRQSEAALRRTIEERARLGRDLHDTVIQSLYATGMGLVGIRALLPSNAAEAERRIDQARAALNETITDLRNFIVGLEPEALKEQSFALAVERLVDGLRAMRPVRAQLAIDEGIAKSLTLAQRAHALQIAREAVSNALRHGRATEVRLSLQRQETRATFIIEDDGGGFDPVTGLGKGRGLTNLTERALELGAELKVSSEIGRGTRVTLILPLPVSS